MEAEAFVLTSPRALGPARDFERTDEVSSPWA